MGHSVTDLAATIPFPVPADAAHLRVVERSEPSLDVVLCCASERVDLALGTFPMLVGEQLLPRLVAGIENDIAPLIDAMVRASNPTLFVLCVGTTIGGARTRQLVETFTARRGPLHRLLVLEVDHDSTDALGASIVIGAQGMRRKLGPRGSVSSALRQSDVASTVTGIVTSDIDLVEPTVPRAAVVVSDPMRDEVGPIPDYVRAPETQRSRPALRLVPDPPPADPAAETARMDRSEVIELVAPAAVPFKGTPWITAAAVAFTIAAVLSFAPPPGVATQLTAGLAAMQSVETTEADAPQAEPTAPSEVEPEPASAEPASSEAAALDAALASGRIRELDLLFVTQPYATTANWRASATRCRARAVNGVRGWRLPKVDELRKLARHQMLPAGVFWTSARVPTAPVPSNQAFDSTVPRVVPLAKEERAETICVRIRPR
jgi:hypothetical protein